MVRPRSLLESLGHPLPGDIIHGTGRQGRSLILLFMEVARGVLACRRITSGEVLCVSGVNGRMLGEPETWIDSIHPLPREFHDAFIDMDRTYRCVDVDV